MSDFTSFVIEYRYYIEIATVSVAVIITVSSFDDVFVDLYYWFLRLFGNGRADERKRVADVAVIGHLRERPFAIMVPAWREHEVIFSMLASNARLQRYQNAHYFVGVYQNDEKTKSEVERAQELNKNIHIVRVPRNGPTSKADCLNEIVAAIFRLEAKNKLVFTGLVMHDAEDLIHPHELQLFNFIIDEYDFIQLPVFSFTRPLADFVGGIYMDEFAEHHTKDLVVRERVSGIIPCAGVSACFSRNAIAMLAEQNKGEAFRTTSFTEDYDIAFRVHDAGLRTTFVSYPVGYTIDMSDDTGQPFLIRQDIPLATREFFPSDLSGAYRQRARWLIGIVFQGLAEFGWRGDLGTKYFLWRDRKSIITNPTVIGGYFVFVNLLLIELYLLYYAPEQLFHYVYLTTDFVIVLFLINLALLIWRLVHRMYFSTRIYDWRHGLMSAPRLIVANFVNFFAAVRAVRVYFGHKISRKPLVWDKTRHSYPFELRGGVPDLAEIETSADSVSAAGRRQAKASGTGARAR